ncbi:MAG: hypothetical protein ABRQ37_25575 [Candidatus Eremiobacterota bacterium]
MKNLTYLLSVLIGIVLFNTTVFAGAADNGKLTFASREVKTYIKENKYSYKITYPKLINYSNKLAENNLNQKIYSIVLANIKTFNDRYNELGTDRPYACGMLRMDYIMRNKTNNIVSIKFKGTVNYGGSNVYPESSLNYDLIRDRDIKLENLFSSSSYLNVIESFCNKEMKKRFTYLREWKLKQNPDDTIESYDDGTSIHYGKIEGFTMTGDSLLIMLGIVGCNADGPQEVTIPYSAMKDIIDPDGPAGHFLKK